MGDCHPEGGRTKDESFEFFFELIQSCKDNLATGCGQTGNLWSDGVARPRCQGEQVPKFAAWWCSSERLPA
jgi:hypothetical protein